MPKEIVTRYESAGGKESVRPPHAREGSGGICVQVGWQRWDASGDLGVDALVQIGVVDPSKGPHEEGRGWFMDLDAAAIRQLVKALRKAERQAYGSAKG
ncbi:MAG: hypothetical protein ACRCYU_12145 [Nocardioides sp.]